MSEAKEDVFEKVKEALGGAERMLIEGTAVEVGQVILNSYSSQAEKTGRLASWGLAAAGGLAAVIVGNLEVIRSLVAIGPVKIAVVTLGLSAALGLIALVMSVSVQRSTDFLERVSPKIIELVQNRLETFEQLKQLGETFGKKIDPKLNLDSVMEEIVKHLPFWTRSGLARLQSEAKAQPLALHCRTLRKELYSEVLVIIQLVLIVLSVCVLGVSVSYAS